MHEFPRSIFVGYCMDLSAIIPTSATCYCLTWDKAAHRDERERNVKLSR